MPSQILIEAAGHLRDLRRSYGYETAASFARAIGHDVARYQRCERSFPNRVGSMMALYNAIKRVGPVSLDWMMRGEPKWEGPLFARAALRVRNGVSAEKADRLFRQELTAARWKRQAQEG